MIEYYRNLSLENLPYINEEGLVCWEEFRDIPGYEGLYQASDLGRIKSLGRIVISTLGKKDSKKSKILKQFNNGRDYLCVQLYNNINKRLYVHRLVALTFIGNQDILVDHKNAIRLDNRLSNLRYLTQRLNCHNQINRKNVYSKFPGVSLNSKGTKKWRAVINIQGIKYYIGSYYNEEEASKAYQNAIYNWENFSTTPKGEKIKKVETKIFKNKSNGRKGENAKVVLDTQTGIYYDCLKDACLALSMTYKHTSAMLIGTRVNKTSLIYV
jgi:hypothetical protein